MNPGSELCFHV